MKIARKMPPIEVTGFRHAMVMVKDDVRQTLDYRWYSIANTAYGDDDFEPHDDDWPNRPPF